MGLSWDVELLLGNSEWCSVGVGLGCGRNLATDLVCGSGLGREGIVSNAW